MTVLPNSGVFHVHPIGDLVDHELVGDGCVCGPACVPVRRVDGSFGWVLVHHALDGRELTENAGGLDGDLHGE